jgi:hypothetical protein
MNDKLMFEALKYIVGFFLSIFLPKKVIYFSRSFLSYLIKNCLRFWYVFVLEIGILLFCKLYLNVNFTLKHIGFNTLLIVLGTVSSINTLEFLKFYFGKSKSFFLVYPTYTIKDNEFIINDIQSERFNEIIASKLNIIKTKFYAFRSMWLKTEMVTVPSFFPILIGFKKYQNFIKRKLNESNPISLYIQKDLLDSELNAYIYFDSKSLVHTSLFNDLEVITLKICKSKSQGIESKIETILFLHLFIIGQSILDFTTEHERYEDSFKILNDLNEQLPIIASRLLDLEMSKEEVDNFYNLWKGVIDRYYSRLYSVKNEIFVSIDFIFKSHNINPYFPQSTYAKCKEQYIIRYLLGMIPHLKESLNPSEINEEELKVIMNDLSSRVEYENASTNDMVLAEIIDINLSSVEVMNHVENHLEEMLLDCNNVFKILFIVEIYKILPLGIEKEGRMYIERIPKVIELLEKAILIDNEFELLHLRIGTLMLISSLHNSNPDLENVFMYINKYKYLYSKYGLSTI